MKNGIILTDQRDLIPLERAGFIKRCPKIGTNKFWSYVDYGSTEGNFSYKGRKYGFQYLDGCFYPYVILLNND